MVFPVIGSSLSLRCLNVVPVARALLSEILMICQFNGSGNPPYHVLDVGPGGKCAGVACQYQRDDGIVAFTAFYHRGNIAKYTLIQIS
jgi:hypothetical protein